MFLLLVTNLIRITGVGLDGRNIMPSKLSRAQQMHQ